LSSDLANYVNLQSAEPFKYSEKHLVNLVILINDGPGQIFRVQTKTTKIKFAILPKSGVYCEKLKWQQALIYQVDQGFRQNLCHSNEKIILG